MCLLLSLLLCFTGSARLKRCFICSGSRLSNRLCAQRASSCVELRPLSVGQWKQLTWRPSKPMPLFSTLSWPIKYRPKRKRSSFCCHFQVEPVATTSSPVESQRAREEQREIGSIKATTSLVCLPFAKLHRPLIDAIEWTLCSYQPKLTAKTTTTTTPTTTSSILRSFAYDDWK